MRGIGIPLYLPFFGQGIKSGEMPKTMEDNMKKKNVFFMGILALVLVLGMTVIGCEIELTSGGGDIILESVSIENQRDIWLGFNAYKTSDGDDNFMDTYIDFQVFVDGAEKTVVGIGWEWQTLSLELHYDEITWESGTTYDVKIVYTADAARPITLRTDLFGSDVQVLGSFTEERSLSRE
jgi:hypothetical protein